MLLARRQHEGELRRLRFLLLLVVDARRPRRAGAGTSRI
jgi:hypothetical protein